MSSVAEHVGLTLPSMSKMIDGLVARRLVERAISTRDRRQVTLALSPLGRATLIRMVPPPQQVPAMPANRA